MQQDMLPHQCKAYRPCNPPIKESAEPSGGAFALHTRRTARTGRGRRGQQYQLESMWDCQFTKRIRENAVLLHEPLTVGKNLIVRRAKQLLPVKLGNIDRSHHILRAYFLKEGTQIIHWPGDGFKKTYTKVREECQIFTLICQLAAEVR